jgi:hypothetical protein
MRIDTQHNPLITQPLQFINWKQFRSNLENIPYENNEINNPEELELLIANTTNEINYSLLNSTITKNKTNSKTRDPQLTNLINNKNRARKNWQRHRTPLNKTIMNNAQELVKKYVRDKNNKSWNNILFPSPLTTTPFGGPLSVSKINSPSSHRLKTTTIIPTHTLMTKKQT